MERSDLLENLNIAANKAATYAIQRGSPLSMDKKSIMIGTTLIEKNDFGTYDILSFDRTLLFKNISVFDVAIIIAQRYNLNEHGIIKKVLILEDKFSKHHTDMLHYLHCLKSAKKKHDLERMAILEDKFQQAEQFAKDTRDRISFFKRVK